MTFGLGAHVRARNGALQLLGFLRVSLHGSRRFVGKLSFEDVQAGLVWVERYLDLAIHESELSGFGAANNECF